MIASQGEYSLITEIHQGIQIDLNDFSSALDTLLDIAGKTPFHGILGTDDSTVELAAAVAKELDLPHNPPEAARLSRRKDLARAHLSISGSAVPIHCLINLQEELSPQMARLPFPCVIKPLNLSASRGVIRANNEKEFISACRRIENIIRSSNLDKDAGIVDEYEQTHVLVEDYIDGIEIAFEGFLEQGILHTLTIFDKPDPLVGPYFDETIYVTPTSLDNATQTQIINTVQKACEAYGLNTGPIHAELRIDKDKKPWILEVAARTIGGDCARTLDSGDGLDLEALTIALALGENIPQRENMQYSRGVMMLPVKKAGLLRRTEGLVAARKLKNIDSIEIIIPDGHELTPLPEGNQYLGYIFASGDNNEEVITAIRQAYDLLNFVVIPVFKLNKTDNVTN